MHLVGLLIYTFFLFTEHWEEMPRNYAFPWDFPGRRYCTFSVFRTYDSRRNLGLHPTLLWVIWRNVGIWVGLPWLCESHKRTILGAFENSRKANISFVMSVRLSAWNNSGFHWTDSHDIWYLNIILKSVEKNQVSLESDRIKAYFTWRPMYAFHHILLNSS